MSDDAARIFEDLHRPTRLAGEKHLHVEAYVGVGRPDLEVECAARAAMVAAAIDLAVKQLPTLLFFESVADAAGLEKLGILTFERPAARGLAHLGHHAIAVAADLSPEEAVETAAHETWHLAARGDDEHDALAYGRKLRVALDPVMAWVKQRFEPRVHTLDYAPGHAIGLLSGVAEPGDLLRAPAARGVLPRCFVNVGSRSPSWRRVS